MRYEQLRRLYEEYLKLNRRRFRSAREIKRGRLPAGELARYEQECVNLKQRSAVIAGQLKELERKGDPAFAKLMREVYAAMRDAENDNGESTGFLQKIRGLVGTVSLLILGTWMIDAWRRKYR
jgi:hypothetical protein